LHVKLLVYIQQVVSINSTRTSRAEPARATEDSERALVQPMTLEKDGAVTGRDHE